MVEADMTQVYRYSVVLGQLPALVTPHVNRALWGFGEEVKGYIQNPLLSGPWVGKGARTAKGRRRAGWRGKAGWVLRRRTGALKASIRGRKFPGLYLVWTPLDYGYWQDTGFRHWRSGKRIHNAFMQPAVEAKGGSAELSRRLDEAVVKGIRDLDAKARAEGRRETTGE